MRAAIAVGLSVLCAPLLLIAAAVLWSVYGIKLLVQGANENG